jgi:hypothetical protein
MMPRPAVGKIRATVRLVTIAICPTIALACPAWADQCAYFNATTNQSVDGRCTLDYDGEKEIVRIGQSEFVFMQQQRQGQWSVGTFNGKPAVRYEINRVTYSYSTLDLTEFLDRSGE